MRGDILNNFSETKGIKHTHASLARHKDSLIYDIEAAPYDHRLQRRVLDLSNKRLKRAYKSSTMFDGEGSPEGDP